MELEKNPLVGRNAYFYHFSCWSFFYCHPFSQNFTPKGAKLLFLKRI
jgi:hypothetical protein